MCTERHTKMRLHSYKSAVCALYAATPAITTMPNNHKCERAPLKHTHTAACNQRDLLAERNVCDSGSNNRNKKRRTPNGDTEKNQEENTKIVDYISSTCFTGASSFNLIEMTMAMVVSIHFRLLYAIPHTIAICTL